MRRRVPRTSGGVQRQISLPIGKAVEIVWKNIRMRLGRSLLVTSGIALATAFLMSMLAGGAMTQGLGDWVQAHAVAGDAEVLTARQLSATMAAAGAPVNGAEGRDARTQTRWLAGLALLVAFIGILNAMLMSVTERFREIGTMKCLGALDSFIIKLFLLESLFQGAVGTAAGVVVGLGFAIASMAHSYGTAGVRFARWGEVAVAVVVTLGVGIVLTVAAALYPAWQAARMQPIEAMRAET